MPLYKFFSSAFHLSLQATWVYPDEIIKTLQIEGGIKGLDNNHPKVALLNYIINDMSEKELFNQLKENQALRSADYNLGYEKGWKDGVADLLKKQQEQEKAFASQKDYEESQPEKKESLQEWAEMHGAIQDKETSEWMV